MECYTTSPLLPGVLQRHRLVHLMWHGHKTMTETRVLRDAGSVAALAGRANNHESSRQTPTTATVCMPTADRPCGTARSVLGCGAVRATGQAYLLTTA
jgi:hypothetical protein